MRLSRLLGAYKYKYSQFGDFYRKLCFQRLHRAYIDNNSKFG